MSSVASKYPEIMYHGCVLVNKCQNYMLTMLSNMAAGSHLGFGDPSCVLG